MHHLNMQFWIRKRHDLMYFGRYRDDYFQLWKRSVEKLESFTNFVNSLNLYLKFTMEFGSKSICFLDLKISILNVQLETTVYSKRTDSHLNLHDKYCHKVSSVRDIQKAVALNSALFAVQIMNIHLIESLRKKCPYSELFWSAFSRLRTLFTQ